MTIPRLSSMNKHWEKQPPLAVMVAAYLGISKTTTKKMSAAEIEKNNKDVIMNLSKDNTMKVGKSNFKIRKI